MDKEPVFVIEEELDERANEESVDSVLHRIDTAILHLESINGDPVVEYRGKTDPERASKGKVLEVLKWWKGELESRICSKEAANFFIYKIEGDRA